MPYAIGRNDSKQMSTVPRRSQCDALSQSIRFVDMQFPILAAHRLCIVDSYKIQRFPWLVACQIQSFFNYFIVASQSSRFSLVPQCQRQIHHRIQSVAFLLIVVVS